MGPRYSECPVFKIFSPDKITPSNIIRTIDWVLSKIIRKKQYKGAHIARGCFTRNPIPGIIAIKKSIRLS
jgi:hypothetical protein